MSEIVGVTELQEMEAEVKLLQEKVEKVRGAENMSTACSRIVNAITSSQTNDGFLSTDGSAPNKFHSSAGSGGDTGCCAIS